MGFCGVEQGLGEVCADGSLLKGLEEGPASPLLWKGLVSELDGFAASPELDPLVVVLLGKDKHTVIQKNEHKNFSHFCITITQDHKLVNPNMLFE